MTSDIPPKERTGRSLTSSFERYLQDKGKGRGGDGGNYRRNAARELERFAEWAAGDRGDDWTGIVPDDVDLDRVDEEAIAELVVSAARDTGSIYRAHDSKIQIAGNGYQVQLPPAEDAGFELCDRAGCHPAPGVLVITAGDGPRARDASRLAVDLVSQRNVQVA